MDLVAGRTLRLTVNLSEIDVLWKREDKLCIRRRHHKGFMRNISGVLAFIRAAQSRTRLILTDWNRPLCEWTLLYLEPSERTVLIGMIWWGSLTWQNSCAWERRDRLIARKDTQSFFSYGVYFYDPWIYREYSRMFHAFWNIHKVSRMHSRLIWPRFAYPPSFLFFNISCNIVVGF